MKAVYNFLYIYFDYFTKANWQQQFLKNAFENQYVNNNIRYYSMLRVIIKACFLWNFVCVLYVQYINPSFDLEFDENQI